MKKSAIIFGILIILIFVSCKENPVNPPENETIGLSYTNKDLGFKISTPDGWNLEEDVQIGEYKAILVGSKKEFTGTQPTFNIVKQEIPLSFSATELISLSEQNLPIMFPGVEIDSKRTIIIDNYECAEIVFHYTLQGIAVKHKQVLFMCRPTILLVITFDSALNEYVRNSEDFQIIQNSIEKL